MYVLVTVIGVSFVIIAVVLFGVMTSVFFLLVFF